MTRKFTWLAAGTATLAITAAMTWLPGLANTGAHSRNDMVVMRPSQTDGLSNVNLVDVLSRTQLREKLGHAEWNGNVLSLELVVSPGKSRPQALFADVEKLIELSFRELGNVNRLLVRMTEREGEGRTLLAAIDVRRSDEWLSEELQSLSSADPVHDEAWRQKLRLSFTRAWVARFGSVAGFSARALPSPAASDHTDVAN